MASSGRNAAEERKLQALLEMGFNSQDCREALQAAEGDPAKALEVLLAAEARVWHKKTARHINRYLSKVRPWSEFFDKFLYPEHWRERVDTNLAHYHANYAIVCLGITSIWLFAQPDLALRVMLCLALMVIVMSSQSQELNPGTNEQDMPVGLLIGGGVVVILACVPYVFSLARLVLVCSVAVLGHASFRARTINSRWSRFSEDVKANVRGITRGVQSQIYEQLHRLNSEIQ